MVQFITAPTPSKKKSEENGTGWQHLRKGILNYAQSMFLTLFCLFPTYYSPTIAINSKNI